MANKNFQKKKIEETQGSGFKKYQENVGGGNSPEPGDPNKRAPGVNSEYRQENNDTMQPRTKDGKFTYKSVNGKSIDPKYGESRGKTVNPLLTGGENGVMIDDVERDFASQSGKYWSKYKDSWYQKGGEIVTTDLKTRVAAEAIWNVAKRNYNEVTGEFGGNIKFQHQLGNGSVKAGSGFGGAEEKKTFEETKKGRSGKEEQAAKQKAKATGEEQAVIEQSTGGIKLKPGTVIPKPAPVAPTPGASVGTTPVVPTPGVGGQAGVVNTASASDIANADYTPKYSDDDIGQARSILQQSGFSDEELADFDAMSPKEKDDYIDKYFDASEEEETVETETEEAKPAPSATPSQPEDSEATKKIKNMGFSE